MKTLTYILLILTVSTGGISMLVSKSPASIPRDIPKLMPRVLTPLDKIEVGEQKAIILDPLPLPSQAAITGTDLCLVSEWPAVEPKKKSVAKPPVKRKR